MDLKPQTSAEINCIVDTAEKNTVGFERNKLSLSQRVWDTKRTTEDAMNHMRMKVEVHLKCHFPFCLSGVHFVCRWSVQSLHGKEIVQHHVSQQQLSVSLGGTVRVSVCTSKEEALESSQPGWAGQLRLWCQYDFVVVFFLLFLHDGWTFIQYL